MLSLIYSFIGHLAQKVLQIPKIEFIFNGHEYMNNIELVNEDAIFSSDLEPLSVYHDMINLLQKM